MSPETLGIVLIAAFGAAGAVARHAVTTAARRPGDGFPWGMLAVNLSGSAAAGAVAAAALAGPAAAEPPLVWAALGTGFLGAYTTASAVALQTLALLRAGGYRRGRPAPRLGLFRPEPDQERPGDVRHEGPPREGGAEGGEGAERHEMPRHGADGAAERHRRPRPSGGAHRVSRR